MAETMSVKCCVYCHLWFPRDSGVLTPVLLLLTPWTHSMRSCELIMMFWNEGIYQVAKMHFFQSFHFPLDISHCKSVFPRLGSNTAEVWCPWRKASSTTIRGLPAQHSFLRAQHAVHCIFLQPGLSRQRSFSTLSKASCGSVVGNHSSFMSKP